MNRGARWFGLLALLVALGVTISACGSSSDDSTSSSGSTEASSTGEETSASGSSLDGKLIADVSNVPNAFITCFQDSYLPPLEAQGAETFSVFGEFTPTGVQQAVQDSITRSPDLALYTGESEELDTQALTELEKAGIPTAMMFGEAPPGTKPQAVLNWNYAEYAEQTAAALAEIAPEIKTVGIVSGIKGNPVSEETTEDLESEFAPAGVEVAGVLYGEFTAQGGATASEDLIQAHPEIEAIITYGDDMALAATRAVSKSGADIPVITVYATTQATIDQVESGQMLFALYEPVEVWSEEILEIMEAVAKGETLPEAKLKQELVDADAAATVTSVC